MKSKPKLNESTLKYDEVHLLPPLQSRTFDSLKGKE